MQDHAANDKAWRADPASVLDYWLGDGVARGWPNADLGKKWFGGGAALDAEINEEFGPQVVSAVTGGLQHWEPLPLDRLALVILLDQFTRNVFRGSPRAFAGDARAQALVGDGIAKGLDRQLPWVGRVFFYMPLMHAEHLALQDECVRAFELLMAQAPDELKPKLQGNLDYAREHREIIARFGRFPHRNGALKRDSTPAETRYLTKAPRFGQ